MDLPLSVEKAAASLRSGDTTSVELTDLMLARADALDPDAYREAVEALDVGARVFGHAAATDVGAHCDDAALVFDIAVYHLTGSAGDIPAALSAFRRAAGPLLERTRSL